MTIIETPGHPLADFGYSRMPILPNHIDNLHYYLAFNLFRSAAIFHAIRN